MGTAALKVSGVPDAIAAGLGLGLGLGFAANSMATLECGNYPNERPLTGTVTLKISENSLPEKIPWQPNAKEGGRRGCKNPQ